MWFSGAGGSTFTPAASTYGKLSFSGATCTFAGSAAISLKDDLTLASGVTRTYTGALTFTSTSTGKTITSAGKSLASAVVFNGVGGGWTLADDLTNTSTLTLTNGTLNLGGFAVSAASLSSSNSNTRTLTLGSGTLTLTGTGTVFDATTSTNLTVTATSGTIKINDASATAKTFVGGGKTYGNIWFTGAGTGTFDLTDSNTFTDFKVDTPPHTIRFTAGITTTVTTFTVNGTAGNLMTIGSITAASHTLSAASGTITCDYLSLSYSTAGGGAAWVARKSTNGGNNSGWSFPRADGFFSMF